ncbi:MAG: Fur family transcriptional regulator [Oscillospiraceae bacterium]|nr:Fur family transcriptional regulator [Oscillospiraceae bacterium]
MDHGSEFEDGLKRSGLKKTKQRTAILGILEESQLPMAADQVFIQLKEKGIPANLSTVYRILEALAEKKLVNKLSIVGDNRGLFELNRMAHRHYLVCLGCKKITAIEHCPLEDYEKALEAETSYKIAGHKLDIYGYCPKCLEKRRKGS